MKETLLSYESTAWKEDSLNALNALKCATSNNIMLISTYTRVCTFPGYPQGIESIEKN